MRMSLTAARLLFALLACAALSGCALTDSWAQAVWWVQTTQRDLHQHLASAMRGLAESGHTLAWPLIGLSLAYGVFHAAGPGHGKAIIATYLGTQESELRRGIGLSIVSSLVQGLTAILIVEVAVGLFGLSMRRAQQTGTQFETLSFALVALLGLLLMAGHGWRLWQRWRTARAQPPAPASLFAGGGKWQAYCDDCGVRHGPERSHLAQPVKWTSLVGVILAIGIRPCTGALLVLLVSHAIGLRWAGLIAVLAMSIGTAAAVSVLAFLSVHARRWAQRRLQSSTLGAGRAATIMSWAGLAGGAVIFLFGLSLLRASASAPAHPLF